MTDRSDPSSLITSSLLSAFVVVLLSSSAAAQTCTPTPNATYGPLVSQTKPANAVELVPGSNLQTAVNAYPAGTVFWLRAGV